MSIINWLFNRKKPITTALTPYAKMARDYRASRNRYPFHGGNY